jgi:O-antigen ligase
VSDGPSQLILWLAAAYLFALTDPLYPLAIRGWSEWATDYDGVRHARRLVWAAHYLVIGTALIFWAGQALQGFARLGLLPPALVWLGASALWSHSPSESAMGFVQFALTLCFGMAAAARIGAAGVVAIVFRAGVICALASWAVATVAPLYGYGQNVNAGALRGVYAEKNHLAIFLSYAVAAGLFEAISTRRKFALLGLALVVATALAAKSSIGVGLMALALLVSTLFFGLRGLRHRGFAALAIVLAAAFALGAILPAALAALGEDPTFNGRTTLWALLWPMVEARPIIGYGFAGFWSGEDADSVRLAVSWNARGAHNGWIEVLLAGGVIGGILWMGLWSTVAWRALAALRPGSDPARGALALIGLIHLVWSCFESHQLGYLSYHAVIAGLVFSLAATGRAAGLAAGREMTRMGAGAGLRGASASTNALRTKSGLPIT